MNAENSAETVSELAVMAARGLRQWDLPPQTTMSLLNLSENATYALLDPASGRQWVLRLHRVGYSSAEEIRSKLAWIDALLRDRVIETAAPLAGIDGDRVQVLQSGGGSSPPRHAVIFERLPGREPPLGAESAFWFERLGRITACLHAHARSWERPPLFRRKRWTSRRCWANAAIGDPGPGRFGLVHADLRLANLLVDGSQLRVIDFDDCGFSWFVYDFAAAASFIEHDPLLPALKRAWTLGYRTIARLASDDEEEIPTFVVLRRILLTAWLASHGELEFARRMGAAYTDGTVRMAQEFVSGKFLV